MGILDRRDDARNSGGNHSVSARRRLAKMRTWLQRHIERRAARRGPCPAPRPDLGMWGATRPGPAAANNHAVFDDQGTDSGIGPGTAETPAAEAQSKLHEAQIVGRSACLHAPLRASSAAPYPASSASAASKSLASRKLR